MVDLQKIRAVVRCPKEPNDIYVLWIDNSDGEHPVLKLFEEGAWRPILGTVNNYNSSYNNSTTPSDDDDEDTPKAVFDGTLLINFDKLNQFAPYRAYVDTSKYTRFSREADVATALGIALEDLDRILSGDVDKLWVKKVAYSADDTPVAIGEMLIKSGPVIYNKQQLYGSAPEVMALFPITQASLSGDMNTTYVGIYAGYDTLEIAVEAGEGEVVRGDYFYIIFGLNVREIY